MDAEAALLAAITADPADVAARLAYADWLEEAGDPRAELVRVEEAMRALPAFADRYWELKPRRDDLLDGVPGAWLTAMGYAGPRPLFGHGVPGGWRERWRLSRAFVECRCGATLGDVGGPRVHLGSVERRAGRALPPSVRECVALADDTGGACFGGAYLGDEFEWQYGENLSMRTLFAFAFLGDPSESRSGSDILSRPFFLAGMPNRYAWAVREADLHIDDPPVHGFDWDGDGWSDAGRVADALSEWALGHLIENATDRGGSARVQLVVESEVVPLLEAAFPIRCRVGDSVVYESHDLFVWLTPTSPGRNGSLVVRAARELPRAAVPDFLWELTRHGTELSGVFAPGFVRRSPPEVVDDVPF